MAKKKESVKEETKSSLHFIDKSGSNRVYIQVKEYRKALRVDIREFFLRDLKEGEAVPEGCFAQGNDEVWQFTSKGISLDAENLGELARIFEELNAE